VRDAIVRSRAPGVGAGFLTEPWWWRTLVVSAERTAHRGGIVRLSVSARQLPKPGPRRAVLDAVDLALLHGCVPRVYRWRLDPTA
jgi:predicted deacetylase